MYGLDGFGDLHGRLEETLPSLVDMWQGYFVSLKTEATTPFI
jgi:hypothetical protein